MTALEVGEHSIRVAFAVGAEEEVNVVRSDAHDKAPRESKSFETTPQQPHHQIAHHPDYA
jgi:hypothetical protein